MGGILQVDTIQNNNATTLITQTNSTTLTFGVSGQNIVIPSGVTFNTASATVNLPTTIKVSTIQNTNSTNLITQTNVTTITFGATSQTISVPSVASFASTIGVGGATPAASGAGVSFPASASASSDANTLDDYEEGTFTPVIVGFTTAGTGTYTYQVGSYTKIGNRVYVQVNLLWTAHTGTGAFQINGLPFTAKNTSNDFATLSIYISEVTLAASNFPMPVILPNTAHIFINQSAVGGSGASSVTIDGSGQFIIAGHYNV